MKSSPELASEEASKLDVAEPQSSKTQVYRDERERGGEDQGLGSSRE
jgi:hypothetical protein